MGTTGGGRLINKGGWNRAPPKQRQTQRGRCRNRDKERQRQRQVAETETETEQQRRRFRRGRRRRRGRSRRFPCSWVLGLLGCWAGILDLGPGSGTWDLGPRVPRVAKVPT